MSEQTSQEIVIDDGIVSQLKTLLGLLQEEINLEKLIDAFEGPNRTKLQPWMTQTQKRKEQLRDAMVTVLTTGVCPLDVVSPPFT